MRDIDIDAVIALSKELTDDSRTTEPSHGIALLVDAIREAGVHVTSENAVALLGDEEKAMNHLLEYMKILKSWGGWETNNTDRTLALNILQSFIIQHMLARLNPDQWSNWYKK